MNTCEETLKQVLEVVKNVPRYYCTTESYRNSYDDSSTYAVMESDDTGDWINRDAVTEAIQALAAVIEDDDGAS